MAPDRALAEQLIGERIGGRFVVERLIGDGPLSSAFRARDELLQRRVTVKLFHPQHHDDVAVVDAQLELAKAVARLSHPNIVTVIDRGEHEGMPLIVLEYVRGENLQERIDRFAPLSIAEVVSYGLSIARALAYAHTQGVVHGNLRPANVLISEEREVKLVDFGGGSFVVALTGDPYASPEVRDTPPGTIPAASADIYALGVLLFVALTEHPPTLDVDASRVQLLRPDVSPKLAALIVKAMAGGPERRYETMHDLAAELGSLRSSTGADSQAAATGRMAAVGAAARPSETSAPRAPVASHNGGAGALDNAHSAEMPDVTQIVPPPRRRPDRGRFVRTGAGGTAQMRARMLAWSMVLLPLLVLVFVGLMIAGDQPERQRTSKESAEKTGPLEVVPVLEVGSFDPPPGDGLEKDEEITNLIDRDVESAWQTEGYDSDRFGGLKPGVGFYFTMEKAEDVRELRFQTDLNGWSVQIYGADLPGDVLDDWEPVSDEQRVENNQAITVDVDGHAYKSYLVWISRLALDDRYRARAAELQVKVVR